MTSPTVNLDERYMLHPAYETRNYDFKTHAREVDIGNGELKLEGTAVTSTAAELNKLDGVAVTAAEMDQRALNVEVTLGTATTAYVVVPWACSLTTAYSVIEGTLSTADETLTLKNNGGTSMTDGVITITQSGSAAGDVDSATPSANNTFTAGQVVQIAVGGENGTASSCVVTLLFDIT